MKDSQLANSSTPAANFYVRVVERNGGGTIIGSKKTTIGNFAAGLTSLPKCATIYGGEDASDSVTIQGTSDGSPSDSYVILQPNGSFVGIGVAAPLQKLHIANAGAVGVRLGTQSISDPVTLDFLESDHLGSGAAGVRFLYEPSHNRLQIHDFSTSTNIATFLRIGNVGVGTVSPDAKFQVGTTPVDSGSYSLSNWNGTGSSVPSFFKRL